MIYQNPQRGFIALISTVIISAILIALMASVGMASFYARSDALGAENKREAQALAESCVNIALLALATSTDAAHYAPKDQIIVVNGDAHGPATACVIRDIVHSGSNATIDAYASSGNSFVSVSAEISLSPSIQVISWQDSQ